MCTKKSKLLVYASWFLNQMCVFESLMRIIDLRAEENTNFWLKVDFIFFVERPKTTYQSQSS